MKKIEKTSKILATLRLGVEILRFCSRLVLLALLVLTTCKPLPPTHPHAIATAIASSKAPLMMNLDFEQPGANLGYVLSGDWSIKMVGDNRLLEVHSTLSNPRDLPALWFGSEAWGNFIFAFKFKILECDPKGDFGCAIIVGLRESNGENYALVIDTFGSKVKLFFGGRNGWQDFDHGVTETFFNIPWDVWHRVFIAADRELISVAIDDTWAIEVTDDRCKRGALKVEVGKATTAQFDDLYARNIP